MIDLIKRLRSRGVLSINRRNAEYIRRFNPRRLYPLVDDKLRTKELAVELGMPVPELFGVITTQHDIRNLTELISGRQQFVVKPTHGSGGNGVLVISGRRGDLYYKASGALLDATDLAHHLSNTLSGLYSLGGQRDRAMVEYCVVCDPELEKVSFRGVPDIRLIVFDGHPVMSMIRLPTRMSDGRANLHQGAVGVGIDLLSGRTVGGVLDNRIVSEHPDTGHRLEGLQIPHWRRILEMSARCHDMTGLGYLGVDIVVDKDRGPLILELNARPGLSIQIANCAGLKRRLELVDRFGDTSDSLESRLEFCGKHFAERPGETTRSTTS